MIRAAFAAVSKHAGLVTALAWTALAVEVLGEWAYSETTTILRTAAQSSTQGDEIYASMMSALVSGYSHLRERTGSLWPYLTDATSYPIQAIVVAMLSIAVAGDRNRTFRKQPQEPGSQAVTMTTKSRMLDMRARPQDPHVFREFIHSAVMAGKPDTAEWCLDDMFQHGVPATESFYVRVLQAYAKKGQAEEAERLLVKMAAAGVAVNVISYNTVIHACAKSNDLLRAEKLFTRMRLEGIPRCVITYALLLDVFAKVGSFQKAELYLTAMKEEGLVPSAICYNTLMKACAKAGRPDRCEYWLKQVTRRGGRFMKRLGPGTDATIRSFTVVAHAYSKLGMWADAERILGEMESKGFEMNEYGLTILLTSYGRAKPCQAKRVEKAFRDYVGRSLQLTEVPVKVLRDVLGPVRAEELLDELNVDCTALGVTGGTYYASRKFTEYTDFQ